MDGKFGVQGREQGMGLGGVAGTVLHAVCNSNGLPSLTSALPLHHLPTPRFFSPFTDSLFPLREFSLWILRKIITSGKWGEEPADMRAEWANLETALENRARAPSACVSATEVPLWL